MGMNRINYNIAAFGIIFDEQGRVLLCHRTDQDLWNLPGGGVESRESPIETARREVREETGFEVEIVKLLGVYNKSVEDIVVFSFLCKIIGGEKTLNNEADKIEYFEVDKLPSNISPRQVERIKDALLDPSEVLFKIQ